MTSEPSENAWDTVIKQNFTLAWSAVLDGDVAARESALKLVAKAVLPVLASGSSRMDPDDLAATVQRTLLRRLQNDADSIQVSTLAEFIEYVRKRARDKKQREKRRDKMQQFPVQSDDVGDQHPHDPVDLLAKLPSQEAAEHEFIDAFVEALEKRGEPDYSIVMGDKLSNIQIAERLGVEPESIQRRRLRITLAIREFIGATE